VYVHRRSNIPWFFLKVGNFRFAADSDLAPEDHTTALMRAASIKATSFLSNPYKTPSDSLGNLGETQKVPKARPLN